MRLKLNKAVLYSTTEENVELWTTELRRQAPGLDLRIWPEVGCIEDIEYAIVARPPKGDMARYSNLKAIFSMWAGVEDLLADASLNEIPIIRMTEPGLTNGIVAYVVHHVTGFHLQISEYKSRYWHHPFQSVFKAPRSTCVGICGFGILGAASADALNQIGFKVIGYSGTRKQVPQVESYAGEEELEAFLSNTDILVCLLPNTPSTTNLINRKTLAQLPKGACIINCGRGESIDDDALLESLRSGHTAGAVLDVFRTEPLPPEHPYWDEPKVTVTPHCASKPDPETASAVILEKIIRFEEGKEIEGIVDRKKAY